MHALNCTIRTPEEISKRIADESNKPVYAPKVGSSKYPVIFHFNFATEEVGEIFLTMQSNKLEQQLVYRGPLKKQITIEAGEELTKDDGSDNFKFRFIKLATSEICTWEQEGGARFWKPKAIVHFDFLPRRELDPATDRPIAYKVRIE